MFVRKKGKLGGGGDRYQIVRSARVDGKPRQKVVMDLGGNATADEAIKYWRGDIARLKRDGYPDAAESLQNKLDRLRGLRAAEEV